MVNFGRLCKTCGHCRDVCGGMEQFEQDFAGKIGREKSVLLVQEASARRIEELIGARMAPVEAGLAIDEHHNRVLPHRQFRIDEIENVALGKDSAGD